MKNLSKERVKSDLTIKDKSKGVLRIIELISRLCDPVDGCPWDQIQSNKSLAKYTIEEAFELVSAIETDKSSEVCSELGDLLFNILFHAAIAEKKKLFSFEDIIDSVVEKMVSRHPHVFGDKKISTVREVNTQWDDIKRNEKKINEFGRMKAEFNQIPLNLPALTYSKKVQKKVAAIDFDWDTTFEIINKIYEEIDEFIEAEGKNDKSSEVEEYGDLLFSIVNLGRFKGIDPETALRKANRKFIQRFSTVEANLNKSGVTIDKSSKDQMNQVWKEIKDRHK